METRVQRELERRGFDKQIPLENVMKLARYFLESDIENSGFSMECLRHAAMMRDVPQDQVETGMEAVSVALEELKKAALEILRAARVICGDGEGGA